jgi:hypothetical protein
MTGNPQENVARKADHAPMIHKPIDPAELTRLLARA